jgi:hypothetical protein
MIPFGLPDLNDSGQCLEHERYSNEVLHNGISPSRLAGLKGWTRRGRHDVHELGNASWESRLTRASRYKTTWQLLPYALRHLTVKPFRSTAEAQHIGNRLENREYRRAAHDMYCEMFLDGYRETTSLRVSRATGLALVLFMIFIFTFDQEFERSRRLGDPPDYLAILDTPRVAEVWGALAQYLHAFGRDDEVLAHLLYTFSTNYDDYCRCVSDAMVRPGFEATVRLVEYDSGRTLLTVYDIIRLFNGHRPHPRCASEFFALGMAGKFLDDLRDMVDDVVAGNPNLLHALTCENEEEKGMLEAALRNRVHITLGWWSRHCPISLESYFHYAFRYYDQVSSTKLRLTLDICLALLRSRLYWRKPIHRSPAR